MRGGSETTTRKDAPSLRLLVIADHLGYSDGRRHGGTTYFLGALPALQAAGVELTACFQSSWHPAADELEAAGVKPVFLGRSKWDVRALGDLHGLAQRVDPHLVHLHTWKSDLLGRFVAHSRGIPAIVHVHDTAQPPRVLGVVQRKLASWTAAMITISDAVQDFAIRVYGMPPEKVHVVHHGIDPQPYAQCTPQMRGRVRRELGVEEGARVVGVIGRVVAQKGQAALIRAMAEVFRQRENVKLLVVGDGPQREECEALAAATCAPGRVIFTGQRLDIPAVLSAVDLVAMPSLCEEGFGFSALEAMAAGRPVVAFRSGGIPALVVHQRTGLLVEKGDVAALGAAIRLLLDDEATLRSLGRGAQVHAQRFSLDRHVQRMLEIYRSVLPRSTPFQSLQRTIRVRPIAPERASAGVPAR